MQFSKQQISDVCKNIAPKYGLDSTLINAICEQECDHDSAGNYLADIGRPETGYYGRYVVKKYNLATTTELLLSCSYGVMQCMGDALYDLGFFQFYFNQCSDDMKKLLGSYNSEFAVPNALDHLVENLEWMIEFGCKHFNNKLHKANGNISKALGYWNGDVTGRYAAEVLVRQRRIQNEG